jgi:signal transduction histidine kinase
VSALPPVPGPSLRRRLTLSVVAIFIASWVVAAIVTTLAARVVLLAEIDRTLDGILRVAESVGRPLVAGELKSLSQRFTDNMVPVVPGRGPREGTPDDPAQVRLREGMIAGLGVPSLNVWVGGIQILVGERTPAFAPWRDVVPGQAATQEIDGEAWRVMYRHDATAGVWYAAGLARRQAQFDGAQLLLRMLLPLALIIPLTVLALYFGIARGLRPLRALAALIEGRRRRQSFEPVAAGGVPEELGVVVEALNHLLARVASMLENEQRFTANAAHELQTPLAAITAEVQLCQRQLQDARGREMLDRIFARVQRASHSVRQLLLLARLDPQDALATEPLPVLALLQDVLSELGHLAAERRLQLEIEVPETLRLPANREAFLILLRNLVSNAFRYAGDGGVVRVEGSARGLLIENDASPVAEPARLVDRFYRGAGADRPGQAPGAGLGLSIVKRICELQGLALELEYRADVARFRVSVGWPAG